MTKITATKVKRELVKNHGWEAMDINSDERSWFANELIKDTLKVVNKILKEQKGISIKNKREYKRINKAYTKAC